MVQLRHGRNRFLVGDMLPTSRHKFGMLLGTLALVVSVAIWYAYRSQAQISARKNAICDLYTRQAFKCFKGAIDDMKLEAGKVSREEIDTVILAWFESNRVDHEYLEMYLRMWKSRTDAWGNKLRLGFQPTKSGQELMTIQSAGSDEVFDDPQHNDIVLKVFL